MKTFEERLLDPNETFTEAELEANGLNYKETLLRCATLVMNLCQEYKDNLEKIDELNKNRLFSVLKQ